MTVNNRSDEQFAVRLEDALETAGSVRLIGPGLAVLTYTRRSLLKIRHVPEQLLDAVLYPVLFVLMFTYVFGGAISGTPEDYLQFALPGILTQTVIFLTIYTAMTINTDIEKGVFDRYRTQPVWRPAHLVGALLADSLRYGIATTLTLAVGLLMGYRAPGGVLGVVAAVAVLFMFCFALSWMWLVIGLKVRTPSAVQGVSVLILFPLTFISSVFAPPETMPDWLQVFVNANPVSQLVDTLRDLMNGVANFQSIVIVIGVSVLITVIFAPIALRIYNRIS
ncbi:MAG TPA: ABC transporter permease [Enteractinococcus helveticum]|uniref:Transport permease protein n=1 Tax=Enteractinococcus helveticum TaxID=1837282 RepID=A0A921FQ86_9MICC|nr:ABC transporter permease [Enteractinococcus helveticum]HJF15137.1 ABC transporter permease [Enteractinococcus helveticum]